LAGFGLLGALLSPRALLVGGCCSGRLGGPSRFWSAVACCSA